MESGALKYDFFNHLSEVPLEDFPKAGLVSDCFMIGKRAQYLPLFQIYFLLEDFFVLSLPCIKVSIFLLFQSLVSRVGHKRLLWAIRCMLAMLIAYMVTFGVLALTACQPIQATWLRYDPTFTKPYKCVNVLATAVAAGSIMAATDFVAVIISLILVWLWEKPIKEKTGVYSLLLFGSL